MGKYDKDRYQKETAIRYCLARKAVPCLEVLVPSASDLTDRPEILTDIDVLGLEFSPNGSLRRTIYDCKSGGRLSGINRAFWASGLISYTGCDDAVIILKNRAVHNHRISALCINVDIQDESSFEELGKTIDIGFLKDATYQASIDRWITIFDNISNSKWASELINLGHNQAPLTREPWKIFRKIVAELRAIKGYIDPNKKNDVSIFMDILASSFILWSSMGRDIRRFYDAKMNKSEFEKILLYYVWGGRESFQIRQELRQTARSNAEEFPSWDKFVYLAGLIINAPQDSFSCINICRDMSIRILTGKNSDHDKQLADAISKNKHARQFILALTDYFISILGAPRDMFNIVKNELSLE